MNDNDTKIIHVTKKHYKQLKTTIIMQILIIMAFLILYLCFTFYKNRMLKEFVFLKKIGY